jgi:hypothetical protein
MLEHLGGNNFEEYCSGEMDVECRSCVGLEIIDVGGWNIW